VRGAARRYRDRVALAMVGGPSLTFAQLDRRSDAWATRLVRRHHVRVGDVVALRLASDLDYVVADAALAKAGAAAAGINPKLAAPEQDALVDRLAPSLVLTPDVVADLAAGDEDRDAADAPHLPPDPERLAAVVLTSGTTGRPKAAAFRNRHLEAIVDLDVGPSARGDWADRPPGAPIAQLASTQFAHIGFMTKLPWYLRLGMTTHVLPRWRADDVLEVVARERIATIGAVAPQVALLVRSPLLGSLDLSCVRTLIVGGAASPPALVRDALDCFDATYSVRYSSTESGGVGLVADLRRDDLAAQGTIGHPRPGVEVRLVEGELCLRSPAVFDGYLGDPEATAAALDPDGWLHTGDLAELDEAGRVRLAGRRSDMYIRGGYNVHPAEVEAVLGTHPAVADVAVAPRADDVMGEIGVAVVVPRAGATPPSLADLRDFAADRLARWKLPEAIRVVDALPLTPMTKLDRAALVRLAAVDHPCDPEEAPHGR